MLSLWFQCHGVCACTDWWMDRLRMHLLLQFLILVQLLCLYWGFCASVSLCMRLPVSAYRLVVGASCILYNKILYLMLFLWRSPLLGLPPFAWLCYKHCESLCCPVLWCLTMTHEVRHCRNECMVSSSACLLITGLCISPLSSESQFPLGDELPMHTVYSESEYPCTVWPVTVLSVMQTFWTEISVYWQVQCSPMKLWIFSVLAIALVSGSQFS